MDIVFLLYFILFFITEQVSLRHESLIESPSIKLRGFEKLLKRKLYVVRQRETIAQVTKLPSDEDHDLSFNTNSSCINEESVITRVPIKKLSKSPIGSEFWISIDRPIRWLIIFLLYRSFNRITLINKNRSSDSSTELSKWKFENINKMKQTEP